MYTIVVSISIDRETKGEIISFLLDCINMINLRASGHRIFSVLWSGKVKKREFTTRGQKLHCLPPENLF